MIVDVVAAALFTALVGAAVVVGRARSTIDERRRVHILIGVGLVGVALPMISQRDLYPFSAWQLVAITVPDTIEVPHLMAVDDAGREYEVDYRAVRPVPLLELSSWFDTRFKQLSSADRASATEWLVSRIEAARLEAVARGSLPEFGVLGRVGAPFFLLHPRFWDRPGGQPARPIVRLRVYRDRWAVGSRLAGADPRRMLQYESSVVAR